MALTATLVLCPLAALPASASAAVSPPTIASQFTPTGIGSGGTTALSFTITNPNPSALTGIGFTDTLPAGLTVDNPNGENGTCGAASTVTAPSGGSTIALAGGALPASAAGTPATCTVQVSVTSTTPGDYQNSTGPVGSTEGGVGNSDTQTLTVFGLPTVSIAAPKEHAVYDFGQRVIANYACADAAGAPGIAACSGDADSGAPLDTSSQGANTFSVSAVSADGAITTQTIDYVVLPDNRVTITNLRGHADGSVTFKVKLPNPGRLISTTTHNSKRFGQTTTKVASDGTRVITVKPNAAARRLIRNDAKAKHRRPIVLRLTVSFTPLLGRKRTVTAGPITFMP